MENTQVVTNNETLEDVYELEFNGTTYITKKMNPKRRGLVIKELLEPLISMGKGIDVETGDIEDPELVLQNINGLATVMSNNLMKVIWAFIKDEDKKTIGTFDTFEEDIDDKAALGFIKWSVAKVKEVQSFLGKGQ